jgi:broad specificity phosphatase PhoE
MLPHHRFFFMRHGETDWNRQRKMQGLTDVPLNALGEAQAEAARAGAALLGLKSIAVSSLGRARRTAEIVNRDLGLALTAFDALREFDVGPYEGSHDNSWMEDWWADRPVEGPELFADFRTRVLSGMMQALALDHPVLVVAHGGVFWALQRMLGVADLVHLGNAELACFAPPAQPGMNWHIEVVALSA